MKIIKPDRTKIGIIIVIGIVLITGIIDLLSTSDDHVVEAINIVDTLEIMGKNNPINTALKTEMKLVEIERSKKIQERLRLIEIARKAAEEKAQKEADRLAEIERRKAEEEARKIEEEKEKNRKVAYLTFDDGPSKVVTPQILDILNEYNIKATFFVIGKMADSYPEILVRTRDEGHAIGNHTYSHNYDYIYKSQYNFIEDIRRAEEAFKRVLGEEFETSIIRFPGGSYGNNKSKIRKAVVDAGYKYFDWNSLNGDAEGILLSKDQLITRFKGTVKGNKELIILMHDTDAKTTTVDALRDILDYLIVNGYEFRVLDENYNR